MKEELLDEILDAVIPSLEAAEAQTAALIQLLEEKQLISAEERERLLAQAANTADIKARGARLRLKRVLTSALKELEKAKEPEKDKPQQKSQAEPEGPEPSAEAEQQKYHQEPAPENKPDSKPGPPRQEKKQDSAAESSETVSSLPSKKAS